MTTRRRRGALACSTCTPGRPTGRSRTRCPTLQTRADTLHQVSPLWFRTTDVDTIEIEPEAPADATEEFVETARRRGVPVIPSVFDRTEAGVMAGILADPAQRARHVDALVEFAAEGDYDGLDIDYEQFAFADGKDSWAATRPNWVAFVDELAARLHAEGRTLTVSIPPVYDAGQTDDSGYWVYDYAAITPLVDAIRVMAYDYSNASTDEGPVAPLDWVERVIAGTSAASGDPSKLVLGVPLYGYNWPIAVTGTCPASAEGVTTVTNRSVDELAQRRGGVPAYDPATRRVVVPIRARRRRRHDFVHAAASRQLRRRRRGTAAHAAGDGRRLRRRRTLHARLRRQRGVVGRRHRCRLPRRIVHLDPAHRAVRRCR